MRILLIPVLLSAVQSEVIKSFCKDIAVNIGEKATLNFQFSENVSQLHRSIKVIHFTSSRQENVLTCQWMSAMECDVRPTYTFDGMISNELRIVIPDVTENHVGRYVCLVLPAEPGSCQTCNVSLKENKDQGSLLITTHASVNAIDFPNIHSESRYDVLKHYPLLPAIAILGAVLLILCVLGVIAARRFYNFRTSSPSSNILSNEEMSVRIPLSIEVGTSKSKQHINLSFIKEEVTVK